jgi:uncharacterized protein YndB with AHSA1/START domain
MSDVTVVIDEIIDSPVEQVFERATDLARYSDWMPRSGVFKECRHMSDEPIRLGTTYLDAGRMGVFRGEVVTFEKPSRVVFKETRLWFGSTSVDVRLLYEFRPLSGGTAVHHTAESELHGMMRMMRPIVALIGRGERRRTLTALKKAAESSVAAETLRAA